MTDGANWDAIMSFIPYEGHGRTDHGAGKERRLPRKSVENSQNETFTTPKTFQNRLHSGLHHRGLQVRRSLSSFATQRTLLTMADSEKKKRKSKTITPVDETTETTPVAEPVDDSAVKSKRKSKKVVTESSDAIKPASDAVDHVEAKKSKIDLGSDESAPTTEDTASKSKRKSRKSLPVAIAEVEKAETSDSKPQEEKTHADAEHTPSKKHKKRTGSKGEAEDIKPAEEPEAAASPDSSKRSAPKRRKSSVAKLDKVKSKSKDQGSEDATEEPESKHVAEEQAVEEPVEDAGEKKKKKKKSKSEAPVEAEQVPEEAQGEEYVQEEYPEEEVVEEEPVVSAPPPRFPPPSAPRKTPSGPVAQGPDVGSVFSMKPTIKFEVEETEVARDYENEDVKRTIDFETFCAAKPHYTIGTELDGTAYYRAWDAKNANSPNSVVVKFYSNEPPRLISEASIVAHVQLLTSLAPSTPSILPLLDEFIGEDYQDPAKVAPGKESASSSEGHGVDEPVEIEEKAAEATEEAPKKKKSKKSAETEEPAVEEPQPEPVAAETEEAPKKKKKSKKTEDAEPAPAEVETKAAEETVEKSKKKSKSKTAEPEPASSRPVPRIAPTTTAPAPAPTSPKTKTFEPDHILVFEALPDVTRYALENAETFSERHVVKIISGLLQAIGATHAAGYMHRAVTPSNVVVTKDGESRLTGFDMACHSAAPAGNVFASEKFKAPEISNEPSHDQNVDLWGIGLIAYFLLTGKPAFRETINARLKIAIRDAKVVYEPQEWESISPAAQEFCKALVVKDPAARMPISAALEHAWIANPSDAPLTHAIANLKA